MTYSPFIEVSDRSPDGLEWNRLSETGIDLSPEHIDRAVQLSNQGAIEISQDLEWQTYLNALALFGVEQWLEEWAPELQVHASQCSLFQPNSHRFNHAITDIPVGRFDLCLIVTTNRNDLSIAIPKTILDATSEAPSFYVLVELLEEQMQVMVYGYLPHEQLVVQRDRMGLRSLDENNYEVPLNWFNLEPTDLLLDLRCLDPVVTLETARIAPQPPILGEPERESINVAAWLIDRLDEAAQALSWVLMPAFATTGGLRTIGDLFTNLEIAIPPEARGAYQDFQVGTVAVRLYAVTWVLSFGDRPDGWTLLTVLSAQPGQQLPLGIQLQIRDIADVLATQVLENEMAQSIYAQVGGEWDETFRVSIQLATGESFMLSPFTFTP